MSKPILIILSGPPATGKSLLAAMMKEGYCIEEFPHRLREAELCEARKRDLVVICTQRLDLTLRHPAFKSLKRGRVLFSFSLNRYAQEVNP